MSFKQRALRFGAGLGAVGLAVGGAVAGYAHLNEQQKKDRETKVASQMKDAERVAKASDIDSLMANYNKQFRSSSTPKNNSYRAERGLKER